MAIKTIEYTVDITGISPATEQFAGTKGDHRVTKLNICVCDALYDEIVGNTVDGKAMYRFDVYDGEGGIWSSEASEFTDPNLSIELEERHTRFGGKIIVYLVITALSSDNETEMELYSFPAVLRLNDKPEGIKKDGENYESITGLVEVAKAKADEAADTVNSAVGRLEETAKITFGKSAYQVAVENGFEGDESDWLASLKGEKGDKGDAFTYDDLTDEQKAELKEGIEQCVADQAYDPTSENAQSGTAVAEAAFQRMPKPPAFNEGGYPRVVYIKGNTEAETPDGMMPDSAFALLKVDVGIIPKMGVAEECGGMISTRDSKGNLWTGTPIENEDCANKQYVDKANKYKMPKLINTQVPFTTVPIVVRNPSVVEDEDGNFYPTDDSYRAIVLDDGLYPKEGTSEMPNAIVARDHRGNLWTGEPVDSEDCVNKKYANQHYVPITKNNDYHPYVYVQEEQSELPSVLGADRIDGYMEAQSENGGLPDGDLSEFGGFIARRKRNGNLLSGTPKAKHDVANKQYVDNALKDFDAGDKVDKVIRESVTSVTSYNHEDNSVPYLYGVYGDKNNDYEEKQGLIKGSTGIVCETLAEQLEEINPELAEKVRNGVVTDVREYLDEHTVVVRDGNCSIPCGFHSIDKDEDGNIINSVLYYGAAVPKPYMYEYVQYFAQHFNGNIRNGTGSSSLQQIQDPEDKYANGIHIVTKNPNAYALDPTLTDEEPIGATGEFATSFGGCSSAQGKRAMAQGTNTVAKGKYSLATGDNSVALGDDSFAHGNTTTTFGMASTAGGFNTVSQGDYSDAGGHSTKATGKASVSRGYMTEASGDYSLATGANTIASGENQTVVGQFNIEDENALFIVGNGTNANNRSNAFAVYKDGSIKIGNTTVTESQLKKLLVLIG